VGDEAHDRVADLASFYASKDEAIRLSYREGRVEFLRTQQLLRAVLRPDCRILDVGGADGAHASWLIEDGHFVEIVDIVPLHVALAKARGLTAEVGDAQSLPYGDETFDAVLLLGPLYHLVESAHRASALAEARRVLRPGGLLAAAGVSRLSVALDYLRTGRLADPGTQAVTARIVASGRDDTGYGAGVFYFHTAGELHDEIATAGFRDISVHGVEGPAWPLIDPRCPPDDSVIQQVLRIATLADSDPSAVGASAHLLALGST
jgi:SAM-dependent methyltransferase